MQTLWGSSRLWRPPQGLKRGRPSAVPCAGSPSLGVRPPSLSAQDTQGTSEPTAVVTPRILDAVFLGGIFFWLSSSSPY